MRHLPRLLIPTSALLLIAGTIACQRSGGESVPSASVKVGASPEAPASESPPPPSASAPSLGNDTKRCVLDCVRARQMEAVGIEVIEANCQQKCAENPKAYGP
jgi:hypothetical protein